MVTGNYRYLVVPIPEVKGLLNVSSTCSSCTRTVGIPRSTEVHENIATTGWRRDANVSNHLPLYSETRKFYGSCFPQLLEEV